ncbi:precorrin-2 C(20)-methyltransferase [Collinsella sp. An2]|uniref:precorrin-2 C(20)-methyltransferase n=1 Tax=Collinsella sp. An2 TaxID=1965585 RepID=UPI000B38DA86|nr:precorrin-2 C(20)-methyltransferase [Collinsella sp. An2]OUP09143.1 precorrin-2 C(20)-methyltransferase [Collinsella sp. An2]
MRKGILYGVGVGPGDPELITFKAVRTIQSCPVVAAPMTSGGGTLALDIVRQAVDLADKRIVRLSFSMSRDAAERDRGYERAAAELCELLGSGSDVALLNLGDPSIYATFQRVAGLVRAAGFETHAVPGVPSFCAVAARLDADLTPSEREPLHIVPARAAGLSDALAMPGTKVVMKAGAHLGELKRDLAEAGVYERVSLVADCGMPGELVVRNLDEAPDKGSYFTTLVIRP